MAHLRKLAQLQVNKLFNDFVAVRSPHVDQEMYTFGWKIDGKLIFLFFLYRGSANTFGNCIVRWQTEQKFNDITNSFGQLRDNKWFSIRFQASHINWNRNRNRFRLLAIHTTRPPRDVARHLLNNKNGHQMKLKEQQRQNGGRGSRKKNVLRLTSTLREFSTDSFNYSAGTFCSALDAVAVRPKQRR